MNKKIMLGVLLLGIIVVGIAMKVGLNADPNTVQAEEPAKVSEDISQGSKDDIKTSQENTKAPQKPQFDMEDLIRSNSEGDVEVQVAFINPIEDNDQFWVFETALNTHIVNLEQYDFSKLISFSTDNNEPIQKGIEFKTEGAGHHIKKYIQIPKQMDGKDVITKDTKTISIQVKDVDNIPVRTFTWDLTDYSNILPE